MGKEKNKKIDDSKKIEEMLRKSKEKYQRIIDNTLDIIYSCNPEGILTFVSPQISSIGYSQEELIGYDLNEFLKKFVHPEDINKVLSDFQRTMQTGKEFPTTFRLRRKDGSYAYVEEKGKVIREGNKIVQLIGVIRDITDQKKTEEKLRESEEKYRTLFEGSINPVMIFDREGTIIMINKTGSKNLNLSPKECLGKSIFELLPSLSKEYHKIYQQVVDTGKVKTTEVLQKLPSGRSRWFWSILQPVSDAKGKRYGVQVISYDTTERKKAEEKIKKSEEKFKLLSEKSVVGIYILQDAKVVYANPMFRNIFGYSSDEILDNFDIKERIYPDDLPIIMKRLKERIEGKVEKSHHVYRGIKKDGSLVYVEVYSIRIDYQDKPATMGTLIDVTEKKELEKDKKILTEKVTKLTKKIPLTNNEKFVFYGLVKYPLLNDHQLSEKLNVKRSTITAVKNKLKIQGFYSTYIIPNCESIGCELMCIIGGKAPIENIEERKRSGMINKIISSPEIVYYIATDKDCLGMIVSKNFVETKILLDYVSSVYEQNNNEMPNPAYFPFAMSKVVNLFDYSNLLKSLFNLNIKEETNKTIKPSKRKLTNNEKITLYALTKYPDLTDTEIAAKTKISRQTVSQIKNNLIEEDFLRTVNIPNVKKLDCELLAYSSGKIDSRKIRKQEKIPSLIFAVHSKREGNGIFIFESYTKHKIEYDKLISLLKKGQLIVGEPKMHLFPIQEIKFQKIDFAPLVKKIFALKTDF